MECRLARCLIVSIVVSIIYVRNDLIRILYQLVATVDKQYSLANPSFTTDEFPQPSIFKGQLKIYQLKVGGSHDALLHHYDMS